MSDWAATERVPAEATLADGQLVEGDLHVQARVALREGPETPLEMLNRRETFFPVSFADGGVLFLSKAQVVVVACARDVLQVDPSRAEAAKRVHLTVSLVTGVALDGWAWIELPPTRDRALDYLNGADRFFTMWTEDVTYYLNRSHVRLVRPHD